LGNQCIGAGRYVFILGVLALQYLSRTQLGREASFAITTVDATNIPGWPTAAPILEVWAGTTLVLSNLKMPKVDGAVTGLFRLNVFLDDRFSAGEHLGIVRWSLNSFLGVEEYKFDVVAGGDGRGAIVSLFHHEMPQERFLVAQSDAGKLFRLKRPSI